MFLFCKHFPILMSIIPATGVSPPNDEAITIFIKWSHSHANKGLVLEKVLQGNIVCEVNNSPELTFLYKVIIVTIWICLNQGAPGIPSKVHTITVQMLLNGQHVFYIDGDEFP